jgi:hypothetical protein
LSSDCPFRAKDLHARLAADRRSGRLRPPLGKTPVQPRVCDESGISSLIRKKREKSLLQFGKNAHKVNRWTVSLIKTEHRNAFGQGVYHFLLLLLFLLTGLLFLLDQAKRVLDKVTPCGSLLCPLPSRFQGGLRRRLRSAAKDSVEADGADPGSAGQFVLL